MREGHALHRRAGLLLALQPQHEALAGDRTFRRSDLDGLPGKGQAHTALGVVRIRTEIRSAVLPHQDEGAAVVEPQAPHASDPGHAVADDLRRQLRRFAAAAEGAQEVVPRPVRVLLLDDRAHACDDGRAPGDRQGPHDLEFCIDVGLVVDQGEVGQRVVGAAVRLQLDHRPRLVRGRGEERVRSHEAGDDDEGHARCDPAIAQDVDVLEDAARRRVALADPGAARSDHASASWGACLRNWRWARSSSSIWDGRCRSLPARA